MFRLNIIHLLMSILFRASKISLCAHWCYDVIQTTPLEQPLNTASSVNLSTTAKWCQLSRTTFGFIYLCSDVDKHFNTSYVMTCITYFSVRGCNFKNTQFWSLQLMPLRNRNLTVWNVIIHLTQWHSWRNKFKSFMKWRCHAISHFWILITRNQLSNTTVYC